MKRKLLTTLLTIMLAICLVGLIACGRNTGENENPNENLWGSVFTIETAYAQAQELGYTGTLEDFLESIKGVNGQNGVNGKDGLGIKSVSVVEGNLIVVLTDDTSLNCGSVVPTSQQQTHTVSFVCEDDSITIPSQTVKHGEKATLPNADFGGLEIEGYFYNDEKWSFIGYPITEDITLTAILKGTDGLVFDCLNPTDDSYYVVDYIGYETSVFIPNIYNGKPVIGIYEGAFYGQNLIENVTISKNIKSIAEGSFAECTSLETVTFKENSQLIGIGHYAFGECSNLKDINIPNGVSTIAEDTFAECTSLESITLPNSIESIGAEAFVMCANLETVTFAENSQLISIGEMAFADCSSLESITLPIGIESIGVQAFRMCSSLASLTLPNSLISIGEVAFGGCSGLESITVESGNTVYHSEGNCLIETATSTLILGCSTSVIPNNVTTLNGYAFADCFSLISITIPNNVTSIQEGAFYGCSGLTSITVEAGNTVYHSAGDCLIETATNSLILGCQNSVIPTDASVTNIASYAFAGCTSLTSIIIPSNIIKIGAYAFWGCTSLTSVTFATTEGWSAGQTAMESEDLTDTATAASYFVEHVYAHREWTRS